MRILGYAMYLAAIAITVLVVASKYFGVNVAPVTAMLMGDPARSLLVALALSLISKWI